MANVTIPALPFTARGNKSTALRRVFLTNRPCAVRLVPSDDLQRIAAARRALTATGRAADAARMAPDCRDTRGDSRSAAMASLSSFALILLVLAICVACTLR